MFPTLLEMAALWSCSRKEKLVEKGGRSTASHWPNLWTMENWRTGLLEVRTKGRAGVDRPSCTSAFLLSIPAAAPLIHLPSKLPALCPGCACLGWRPHLSWH